MAAAVGELGLAADTAGGRVVLLLCLLTPRLRPDATHFLFVALKLLVQRSEGGRGGENGALVVHHSLTNFFLKLDKLSSHPVHKQSGTSWSFEINESFSKRINLPKKKNQTVATFVNVPVCAK